MRGLLPFFLLSFLSPPWPLELLHAGEDSCDLVVTRRGVLAGSGVLETRRAGGSLRDLLVASRWAARRRRSGRRAPRWHGAMVRLLAARPW